MTTTTFTDGFDTPDPIAFGLPAPQLLVVAGAGASAYLVVHSPVPTVVRAALALALTGAGTVLGWGRLADRPALTWLGLATRFALRSRQTTFVLRNEPVDGTGEGGDTLPELPADIASQPWAQWLQPPSPSVPPHDDEERHDEEEEDEPATVSASSADRRDEAATTDEDEEHGIIVPFSRGYADIDYEEDSDDDMVVKVVQPPIHDGSAPVFVGAPRRLTFFSLNGGTGKTALATEVAAFLASRGVHSRDGHSAQPLKVALLDLDVKSANVGVRLGIAQPTIWDYLFDSSAAPDVHDYLVHHRSGVDALLGPPKPLGTNFSIDVARIESLVEQLEADGYHFIVIDVAADLNAVTRWALSAVHNVFVVLTPTATGVQDAYRTTETLRSMGLRHKLNYVINRSHGANELQQVMGDLGGRVLASVPYDTAFEEAENHHRLAAPGAAAIGAAIGSLAAHLYPPLQTSAPRSKAALPWRRRAGSA